MLTRVCQSSGSGCSPNSSTHCSVQGRICPCKNGSMDTFTTCASPRSNNLPSSALNSDPFLSPTQDAGLPWPWALGVPKKKEAASSNGYTQTHCGPMVAWSTRFRCLYKTWNSQKWPRTVPSKGICSIVCHICASQHHDSLSFVRRWFFKWFTAWSKWSRVIKLSKSWQTVVAELHSFGSTSTMFRELFQTLEQIKGPRRVGRCPSI